MLDRLVGFAQVTKGTVMALLVYFCLQPMYFPQGETIHRGTYCNHEYGYCVIIPKGIKATSDPPPLPQHGFRIKLSDRPESYIWVDGSYNASDWTSAEQALDVDVGFLKKEAAEVTPLNRSAVHLGRLPAVRSMVRFKDSVDDVIIQDIVVALRPAEKNTNIVYTLGLRAPESRYRQYEQIFLRLIAEWKLTSLPR